jgi:Zn-dependent protease
MTLAIGYIFSTMIKKAPTVDYDPLTYFAKKNTFFEDLKYGIMIAAPAIVLHELMHKFTAIAFGAVAILKAPLDWYIVTIILRLINFPIFFFVGGYVVHSPLPPLQSALVSVSGPLLNLTLFLICKGAVHFKLAKRKHYDVIGIVSKLNLFLFIFNMLPIPSFDGFNFYRALILYFFKV